MRWRPKDKPTIVWEYAQWYPWFAWYPVKIHDTWVWLERIQRRRQINTRYGDEWYEYAWPSRYRPD